MPDLPTITVSQTQADKIMSAYAPGGTQAQAVTAYKEWLRREVSAYVKRNELAQLRLQHKEAEEQAARDLDAALLPPPPDPPSPPLIPQP
jgi:hypothetical protein